MRLNSFQSALTFVFVLMMMVTTFSGCDLFDKADDITFPSEVEVEWIIDENDDGENVPYGAARTVNLADDPETEKYLNKIKDVTLEKITYKISEYDATPHNEQVILVGGTASFSAVGSSTQLVTVPFAASDINLQTITEEGELDIDANGLNALAGILTQEKELTMNTAGVLSKTPVSFKIVATFHVKITAEVLD